MNRVLKVHDDQKLARKIARLRAFSAVVAVLGLGSVAALVAGGELTARGSFAGGRFVSDGVLKSVTWDADPFVFLVTAFGYVAIVLLLVICFYLVTAKLIEKAHGRPLFRRKYPY